MTFGIRSPIHATSSGVSSPWSWTTRRPTSFGDLHHPLTSFVAEHADGEHLGREATHDVRGDPCRDLRTEAGTKFRPTASAPRPAARRASSGVVIPQIFTNTGRNRTVDRAGSEPISASTVAITQPEVLRPRRTGSPERTSASPDQNRVVACLTQQRSVFRPFDAGLGHANHGRRNRRSDPHGTRRVDLERDEITLIHTDERGPDCQRSLDLRLVVRFDQGVEPQFDGKLVEVGAIPRRREPPRSKAHNRRPSTSHRPHLRLPP